jgi:hypothetical protein
MREGEIAMALFGIDTSGVATQALATKAASLIGGPPKFWGRYFNGTTSDRKYQYETSENAVLHQMGVPVLCLARQMQYVGDPTNAAAHAKENMKGVVDAFGAQYLLNQNLSPILYLDLEPESSNPAYILDQQYYATWSATIVAGFAANGGVIHFRPAVYLNQGDSQQSWLRINNACATGSVCVGAYPAHYVCQDPNDKTSPPPLSSAMTWNDPNLTPKPDPIPHGHANANIPVLAWQYYGDYPKTWVPGHKDPVGGDIDFNMVNPACEQVVLSGLVLPPAGAPV